MDSLCCLLNLSTRQGGLLTISLQWFYAIARKPEEVKIRIEAVASI